jgi:hypothetical protein
VDGWRQQFRERFLWVSLLGAVVGLLLGLLGQRWVAIGFFAIAAAIAFVGPRLHHHPWPRPGGRSDLNSLCRTCSPGDDTDPANPRTVDDAWRLDCPILIGHEAVAVYVPAAGPMLCTSMRSVIGPVGPVQSAVIRNSTMKKLVPLTKTVRVAVKPPFGLSAEPWTPDPPVHESAKLTPSTVRPAKIVVNDPRLPVMG